MDLKDKRFFYALSDEMSFSLEQGFVIITVMQQIDGSLYVPMTRTIGRCIDGKSSTNVHRIF
jgi:hypothetical protein